MELNGGITGLTSYKYKNYIKIIQILYIFSILFVFHGSATATELCKPYRYADGDTFTFMRDGVAVRVRVAGYDAPERGQPYSGHATDRLRAITEGGAWCDCYKQDRYSRNVCTVRTLDRVNVATLMLGAGLGCIDSRFENEANPKDRADGQAALLNAQTRNLGMWSAEDALCAYEFRRLKNAK